MRLTSRIMTRRKTSGHKSTFRESTPSDLRNTNRFSIPKWPAGPSVNIGSLQRRVTGCFSDAQTAPVSFLSWQCGIPIVMGWSWLFRYRAADRSHRPKGYGQKHAFTSKRARGSRVFRSILPGSRGHWKTRAWRYNSGRESADTTKPSSAQEFARGLISAFGRDEITLWRCSVIGSVDPVSLKVIGTFQMRLWIRHRLDVSLQMKCESESRRSSFSPASAGLASGTVILNSVLGGLIFWPSGAAPVRGCLICRGSRPGRSAASPR